MNLYGAYVAFCLGTTFCFQRPIHGGNVALPRRLYNTLPRTLGS